MRQVLAALIITACISFAPSCFLGGHTMGTMPHMHTHTDAGMTLAYHMDMYHTFGGAAAFLYALIVLSSIALLVLSIFLLGGHTLNVRSRLFHRARDALSHGTSKHRHWLARHTLAPPRYA